MSRWLGWYRSPMASAIPAATCSIRGDPHQWGCPCRTCSMPPAQQKRQHDHIGDATSAAHNAPGCRWHRPQGPPLQRPAAADRYAATAACLQSVEVQDYCQGIGMLMCILDSFLCAAAAQPHVCSRRTSGDYAHGLHPRLLQVCQAHAQRRRPWMVLCTPHSQQPVEASSVGH